MKRLFLLSCLACSACTGLPPMPTLSVPPSPVSTRSADPPEAASRTRSEALQRDLQWLRTADEQAQAEQAIANWMATPIDAERAVDIALLNNPALQARLAELGIGLADLEQARRLPNPGFTFERTRSNEGLEIQRGLHFNLVRLVFYPQLKGIEARRFEQTRLLTLHEALNVANRTRRAFYEAVAARQKLAYAQQVKDTAEAAGELARRLEQVGNYNTLSRAREQAFALDAEQAVTRARQQEAASRIRLLRLLGLPADTPALRLPDQLPPLPAQLRNSDDIRRIGVNQRLDVQAAQAEALRSADLLGLTKATRFITVFELGGLRESTAEGGVKRAVEVGLQLPVFDSGDARVARAEATYQRSLARVRASVLEADGDVRLALDAWQTNWELARRQSESVIPLRTRITSEALLRYNGMIGSVFELLAESRAQISSVATYIDLLRDFWQADSDLNMSLLGKPVLLPGTGTAPHGQSSEAPAAAATPHPGGGH